MGGAVVSVQCLKNRVTIETFNQILMSKEPIHISWRGLKTSSRAYMR